MRASNARAILIAGAWMGIVAAVPATAGTTVFNLHDHPNGQINPPSYGLRIDDLFPNASYTFSFDYVGLTSSAAVTLTYDDVLGTVRINGRAFGGKDTGTAWAVGDRGWINIDFTYTTHVSQQDNCAGAAGNDVYVRPSALNAGTISLDGWRGNVVFSFSDKADDTGCSFVFDNDWDSKGNAGIANNPAIWSGNGWLSPPSSGSRDWLFIGEMATLPVHVVSWGAVKAMYR